MVISTAFISLLAQGFAQYQMPPADISDVKEIPESSVLLLPDLMSRSGVGEISGFAGEYYAETQVFYQCNDCKKPEIHEDTDSLMIAFGSLNFDLGFLANVVGQFSNAAGLGAIAGFFNSPNQVLLVANSHTTGSVVDSFDGGQVVAQAYGSAAVAFRINDLVVVNEDGSDIQESVLIRLPLQMNTMPTFYLDDSQVFEQEIELVASLGSETVQGVSFVGCPYYDEVDDPHCKYPPNAPLTSGLFSNSPNSNTFEMSLHLEYLVEASEPFDLLVYLGTEQYGYTDSLNSTSGQLDAATIATVALGNTTLLDSSSQFFELPPGYTVSSIDGFIQSNVLQNTGFDCAPDLTGEGDLNFLDVSAFLAAFASQDPVADFEPDGNFNFLDVSAYLAAFAAGCP